MHRLPSLRRHAHEADAMREECGIFCIFGSEDASAHTALGLHALQHRGQEAAGIVSFDGEHFRSERGPGEVSDNFGAAEVMTRLTGSSAIGHVRYSTTGETIARNIQPLFAEFAFGGLAVAHNGNLTNAFSLRTQLVDQGCIFQSTTDTEVIIHLMALSDMSDVVERMIDGLGQVEGAYSLVAMTNNAIIGARDPLGVRPLVLGKLDGATILASESCALDIIGADVIRDIEPGELVVIDANGIRSYYPFDRSPQRFCIFEYIYFARPDSVVEGTGVYDTRKRIGTQLARESHVEADIVIPVPDSGTPAAIGYASEAGIPFELGIIRNHYVGRTFIEPAEQIRHLGVKLKHSANRLEVTGKRIILVDDSIVRGTTSTKIVEMMRNAGATEVHMRVASPPIVNSCYYGVDTPERDKLLASDRDVEAMRKFIGADSLAFVTIDGLYRAVGNHDRNNATPQFCDACFTGDYPTPLTDREEGEPSAQLSLLSESY